MLFLPIDEIYPTSNNAFAIFLDPYLDEALMDPIVQKVFIVIFGVFIIKEQFIYIYIIKVTYIFIFGVCLSRQSLI